MIAPKVVSHVQPTGRDYSGKTSPDIITHVPSFDCRTCGDEFEPGVDPGCGEAQCPYGDPEA